MLVNIHKIFKKSSTSNENIVDEEKSSIHLLGIFADTNGIGMIVIKYYHPDIKRIDVIEEKVEPGAHEIENFQQTKKEWKDKYKIKHFFGNEIAVHIVKEKTSFNNDGIPTAGWQDVNITPEHMKCLVQWNIKKLRISENIKHNWRTEMEDFDFYKVENKLVTYFRIYALGCILKGLDVDTTRPLFTI